MYRSSATLHTIPCYVHSHTHPEVLASVREKLIEGAQELPHVHAPSVELTYREFVPNSQSLLLHLRFKQKSNFQNALMVRRVRLASPASRAHSSHLASIVCLHA